MDDTSAQKLQEIEAKLDAVLTSVEKTRRNFQITMWITIVCVVAPLVISVFVVPMFLKSYVGSFSDDASSQSPDQSQLDNLKDLLQ